MLTSFHIKNFRSCKDVKLENMGPMLGLVGRNGAGKTTILRAIEWVASTALSADGFWSSFSYADVANPFSESQAELTFTIDDCEYRYSLGRAFRSGERPNHRSETREREMVAVRSPGGDGWVTLLERANDIVSLTDREQQIEIGRTTAVVPALSSLLPKSDALQVHLHRLVRVLGQVHYYVGPGQFKVSPSFGNESGPISSLVYDRWVETGGPTGDEHAAMLFRLVHAERTVPEVFAELKRRVGPEGLGLLDDIRVVTLNELTAVGGGPSYYHVMFKPMGQGSELALSQLSGGTHQMLYLMLALLLDQSSTMLVEQPEDGIHPALLAKLIDIFRVNTDPTQIVLASHSPTVLSCLRPEDVRLVEMRDGSTQVRALTGNEVQRAQEYMQREGSLAEFLELIQED